MTPLRTYPSVTCGANLLEVPRAPDWCAFCKIQINPGDPCRFQLGIWVCEQEACWNALEHNLAYPFDGPTFFSPITQHLKFRETQNANFRFGRPLEDWATWCDNQQEALVSRRGASFILNFAEVWRDFPQLYRKEHL